MSFKDEPTTEAVTVGPPRFLVYCTLCCCHYLSSCDKHPVSDFSCAIHYVKLNAPSRGEKGFTYEPAPDAD